MKNESLLEYTRANCAAAGFSLREPPPRRFVAARSARLAALGLFTVERFGAHHRLSLRDTRVDPQLFIDPEGVAAAVSAESQALGFGEHELVSHSEALLARIWIRLPRQPVLSLRIALFGETLETGRAWARQNWNQITSIAGALIEHQELDATRLKAIVAGDERGDERRLAAFARAVQGEQIRKRKSA
jgi:hypothetical protein